MSMAKKSKTNNTTENRYDVRSKERKKRIPVFIHRLINTSFLEPDKFKTIYEMSFIKKIVIVIFGYG